MAVRVAVCRTLRLVRDGVELSGPRLGTRKARVLLAALCAARGAPVSTDRLTEAIWPDGAPRDPVANLATLASRLRRTAGDDLVVPGAASYALGSRVELDLDVAADLLASATTRLRSGEPTLAVASATRAVELIGDGRLAEEYGDWAQALALEAAERCRQARHLLARSATLVGRTDLALSAATEACAADPLDERAHRDLMRALVADGRPAAALDTYTELSRRLADELGTDPDQQTQHLHLAVLRGESLDVPGRRPVSTPAGALVGREQELHVLDRAWADASAGRSRAVLVDGVPGIGKTRLLAEVAALASRSGGRVLATVCRPGERSLFLQPFLDVLRPVLLSMPAGGLATVLGPHLATWGRLLPELGEVLEVPSEAPASDDLVRRRSFDAVAGALEALTASGPVLLVLDDLQYAADATVDLLAHLTTRLEVAPLVLLAATRTEALPDLARLTDVEHIHLGPLPPSAVDALAAAAGFSSRAAEVQARCLGHPLSVVASLQSLAAGTSGVPEGIADAVAGQLTRLAPVHPDAVELARAAAVLGTRVDPALLGRLVDRAEVEVALACGPLCDVGLMSLRDRHYAFANDLVRDAVLATLPPPAAAAYHRRAADLLADRPEEMAGHAHAAGDPARAARGYLEAGRQARRAAGLPDALALLRLALEDARAAGDPALEATVLLEQARAHETRAAYAEGERAVLAARELLAGVQEPRLEVRCLRLLGGDISVGCERPLDGIVEHNRTGAELAAGLGDAVGAAAFRTRIVILECSRARLRTAHALAVHHVAEARMGGSAGALARALDGLKSVLSHLGDAAGLARVLAELLPLLDRLDIAWLRQWAVLESALVPAACGDWSAALATVDRALELNRATGYEAYAGYFRALRAWLARLAGDLDTALAGGRAAVAAASPTAHPWWYATAVGVHAASLLQLGRNDEAAALCRAGLAALGGEAGTAYRLRCLAPLAAATGEGLAETDRLLGEVDAPGGHGWVLGADVYESVARAWLAAGDPQRAAAAARPLLAVTGSGAWDVVHARLRQSSSPSS